MPWGYGGSQDQPTHGVSMTHAHARDDLERWERPDAPLRCLSLGCMSLCVTASLGIVETLFRVFSTTQAPTRLYSQRAHGSPRTTLTKARPVHTARALPQGWVAPSGVARPPVDLCISSLSHSIAHDALHPHHPGHHLRPHQQPGSTHGHPLLFGIPQVGGVLSRPSKSNRCKGIKLKIQGW